MWFNVGCTLFDVKCWLFCKGLLVLFEDVAPLVADKIAVKIGCDSP